MRPVLGFWIHSSGVSVRPTVLMVVKSVTSLFIRNIATVRISYLPLDSTSLLLGVPEFVNSCLDLVRYFPYIKTLRPRSRDCPNRMILE